MGSRIVVRDLDTGKERSFEADVPSVDALAVLEDGAARRIVSAGPQGVRIWDLDAEVEAEPDERRLGWRNRPPSTPRGLRDMWPLCRARYSRENVDVAVLALGSLVGLDIHDAATGKPLRRLDAGPVVAVRSLPSAPGTALVAVTGRDSWTTWD
ncbi:hypothetical protein ACFV8T_41695 [Streptomyces sp. NPDC059832]|uniref:hypothetical protein n=1 Tax=Streptomyces sp. NPDC059832 TaxID=3346966 RepID=UPI00364FE354